MLGWERGRVTAGIGSPTRNPRALKGSQRLFAKARDLTKVAGAQPPRDNNSDYSPVSETAQCQFCYIFNSAYRLSVFPFNKCLGGREPLGCIWKHVCSIFEPSDMRTCLSVTLVHLACLCLLTLSTLTPAAPHGLTCAYFQGWIQSWSTLDTKSLKTISLLSGRCKTLNPMQSTWLKISPQQLCGSWYRIYFIGKRYSGKSDRGGQGLVGLDEASAQGGLAWNIATPARPDYWKGTLVQVYSAMEVVIKTSLWLKGQYFLI